MGGVGSSNRGERRPVLVAGIGNLLMGDEGIGCRLVQYLETGWAAAFPEVEFADLGLPGLRLAYELTGRKLAILVDCARMGAEPGSWRCFSPSQVRSLKRLPGFSLHEGDLLQTLDTARRIGEFPEALFLFGIEPARIGPGIGLSRVLESRIPNYAAALRTLLQSGRREHETPGSGGG